MLLKRLGKTLSIILAINFLGGCKQDIPDNSPCLVDLKTCQIVSGLVDLSTCQCGRYKLVDKDKIAYQFDKWVQLSSVDDGFCFQKGELEKVLQWGRDEKKACEKQ